MRSSNLLLVKADRLAPACKAQKSDRPAGVVKLIADKTIQTAERFVRIHCNGDSVTRMRFSAIQFVGGVAGLGLKA